MTAQSSRRSAGRPWPKGVSGNPGGRPRGSREVKELLGSVTYEAIERLIAIMRGKDVREARLAAEALLDRQLGKPKVEAHLTAGAAQLDPQFRGAAVTMLLAAVEAEERIESGQPDYESGVTTGEGDADASVSAVLAATVSAGAHDVAQPVPGGTDGGPS